MPIDVAHGRPNVKDQTLKNSNFALDDILKEITLNFCKKRKKG